MELREQLEMLRALGVRRATFDQGELVRVEFFGSDPAPTGGETEVKIIDPEPDVPAAFVAAASAFQPQPPKGSS